MQKSDLKKKIMTGIQIGTRSVFLFCMHKKNWQIVKYENINPNYHTNTLKKSKRKRF